MKTSGDRIESFIDRLVKEARPVRRLWRPAARLAAWLGVLLVVAATVAIAGLRPDIARRLMAPGFLAEIAALGAATIAGAWIALQAAVPGLDGQAGRRALLAALLAGGALGLVETTPSFAASLADFVDVGVPCMLQSVALASLPWGALLWAVGRGLPLRPVTACAAGGLAASLGAYLLMRLRCPLDETMHVGVWHGAPMVAATIAAAAVGAVLARARGVTKPAV